MSKIVLDQRLLRVASHSGAFIFGIVLLFITTNQFKQHDVLLSRAKAIQKLSEFAQAPNLLKSDGYISASAYKHALESSAKKGQDEYISQWKAKNLKSARETVKGAATLYSKWDVVDPYTGYSKDDLTPFPLWNKVSYLYKDTCFL